MTTLHRQSQLLSNNASDEPGLFDLADDSELDELDEAMEGADETPLEYRPTILPTPNIEYMRDDEFADKDENFNKTPQDMQMIKNTISEIVLFENIDADQMEAVVNYFYLVKVKAGDVVIRQGDAGDAFYVVRNGEYICEKEEDGVVKHVMDYHGQGYFGDLALLYNAPRFATIRAKTDGEVFALNAVRFSWIQKKQAMENAAAFNAALRNLPLMRHTVDPKMIGRIVDALEVLHYEPGTFVCHQGDAGNALYFVLSGSIDVVINGKVVDKIGVNEFFGERALLLNEPRAASCYVTKKAKLAMLTKTCFEKVFPPDVLEDMKHYVTARYEEEGELDNNISGVQMVIDDDD